VSASQALANLAAWWLQSAALLAAALLLGRLLRSSPPAAVSGYWRAVLATGLALPLLAPWGPTPAEVGASYVATALTAAAPAQRTGAAGWVLAAIAAVSTLRLALLAWAMRRLSRWAGGGTPFTEEPLFADSARLVGTLAEVRISPAVGLPAAAGWRRPVVLLPTDFPRWREEERRHALVHELLHVRRRDWAAAVLEEAVASALWFHPGVRWVMGELRLARERAVDEETAALTDGRRAYAGTLVTLAGRPQGRLPAPALFATRLERRVDGLLKEDGMSKAMTAFTLGACGAVLLAVGALAARAFPVSAEVGGAVEGAVAAGGAEAKRAERRIVTKANPVYPAEAKQSGIEGKVVLDVLVTAAGSVTDVKVESGPEELREASVDAVRQWQYEAAPADSRMTLTIRFRLAKDDGK